MERPTFHESWHRVAHLAPRLRASIRVTRQRFRAGRWHVLEEPASGLYYRVNDAAYDFLARLDGKRSVAEAWRATAGALGDESLTQGEAIGLLGRLWQSNLLWTDAPGDARELFARQRDRVARERRGYLANLLFLRVPLLNPDSFLDRWAPLSAWAFGPIGALAWAVLLIVGAWHVVDRWDALSAGTGSILAGENLLPLYLTYAAIKALHELGHACSCKVFGLRNGRGGDVRTIGVMFFLFLPVPYVDASSAWAFRSRLQRIIVSAAGIIVETACAAVAAIVWARTGEGSVAHEIAFNAMVLAGVSTILFNGNPLLRYDGYYIASDLVAIPNLAARSRDFLIYLVKHYLWNVRNAASPAHSPGEARLLFVYGVASGIYRVLVYVGVALFIASQHLLLGGAILFFGVAMWLILPAGRLAHYLLVSGDLDRSRPRAWLTTTAISAAALLPAALVPVADHSRAEGIAEPRAFEVVYARADGFIERATASGSTVEHGSSEPLLVQRNDELIRRHDAIEADLERLRVARALAFRDDPATAQPFDTRIDSLREQQRQVSEQIGALRQGTSIAGRWIAPSIDRLTGAYLPRGTRVGLVADLSEMRVRAVLSQRTAALVIDEAARSVDVRAKGRPAQRVDASLLQVVPGGQRRLPSASLGVLGGGFTPTSPEDQQGLRTTEEVFDAWISLPPEHGLLPGQRVVVRFALRPRPLLAQGWRALRQVLQERFNI